MSARFVARWTAFGALISALALTVAVSPVVAEDVEKKFRISVALGGYNTQDEVRSSSANVTTLRDDNGIPFAQFRDPRNDSGVFGDLTIKPATRATIAAQYAVSKIFMVEASVGYQRDDVGDIEVQAQFDGTLIPTGQDFQFEIFRIPAGEMEQVPIQLTALARFRPRATFNPYVGGGLGYVFIGFEPSDEMNQLSARMDASKGSFAVVTGGVVQSLLDTAQFGADLEGARVDARDTFAWHLAGGAELSFKRKWVVFADLRYVFASRTMSIGFNGGDSLGISVPNRDERQVLLGSIVAGAMRIRSGDGGLVDAGRLIPLPGQTGVNCNNVVDLPKCQFVLQPDGQLDPGFYYAQGGSVKYGGVSAQFGVRYTF